MDLVLIMLGSLILPAIAEFVLMYIISDKTKDGCIKNEERKNLSS